MKHAATSKTGRDAARRRATIRSPQDVVDLVNSGTARGGNEKAIVLIALGGIFIDAYDFTALAFGLNDVKAEFHLGSFAEGVIAASIMVGAIIGGLLGGHLVDKLGRYKLFMADMIFFVVAALACAAAPNAWVLGIARLVMGFGIGLDFPVALAFLAEFSSLKGKGGRVSLWQPMWYVATGCSFLVLLPLYFLIPSDHHNLLWRFAVGFGAVPALVVTLVRHRYMDESPSWAAKDGDLERAAEILQKSYGLEVTVDADPVLCAKEQTKSSPLAGFAKLFNRKYLRRTIEAGVVGACQSMQYYAVGFFLPTIVLLFVTDSGRLTSIIAPLIFNFVFGVTGGFLGVKLFPKLGSWGLSTIGFAVALVALVVLGFIGADANTFLTCVAGIMLGLFVFFHAFGPGAQGMTLATLSYPTSMRGVGSGFGQATLRVGSTISLLWFPTLSDDFGSHVFWLVAIAPLLGLITLLACRWEPLGKDVDLEDFETAPENTRSTSSALHQAAPTERTSS